MSRLVEERAAGAAGSLACPGCVTRYPRVDGVPCVPPDLAAFLAAQAAELPPIGPTYAPGDAEALCRRASRHEPGSAAFREALFAGPYALAHFPPADGPLAGALAGNPETIGTFARWLATHEAPQDAPVRCLLEAGCGPGALLHAVAPHFPEGAFGLDLRIGVLRLARRLADTGRATPALAVEGHRVSPAAVSVPEAARAPAGAIHLVQGDVLDPPFPAESFAAVAALSLLDTIPDPVGALGQLDALLAPGGLLLLATPWSWDARVTPPASWWSTPDASSGAILRAALEGRHPALPHLRYELLEEAEYVPWSLPGHGRLVLRYLLDAVLARKAR